MAILLYWLLVGFNSSMTFRRGFSAVQETVWGLVPQPTTGFLQISTNLDFFCFMLVFVFK